MACMTAVGVEDMAPVMPKQTIRENRNVFLFVTCKHIYLIPNRLYLLDLGIRNLFAVHFQKPVRLTHRSIVHQ